MPGSDSVTTNFLANESTTCSSIDRFVPAVAAPLANAPDPVFPLPDACATPDWTVVSCARDVDAGTMLLEVRRPISVANPKQNTQDRSVSPGAASVLAAYAAGPLAYHGANRVSADIILYTTPDTTYFSAALSAELPADVDGYFDFRFDNYTIPRRDTTYTAASFRVPRDGMNERMIVAVEPLIDEDGEGRDMVHHFLLYLCGSDEYARLTKLPVDTNEEPFGPLGNPRSGCSTLVYLCKSPPLFFLSSPASLYICVMHE